MKPSTEPETRYCPSGEKHAHLVVRVGARAKARARARVRFVARQHLRARLVEHLRGSLRVPGWGDRVGLD